MRELTKEQIETIERMLAVEPKWGPISLEIGIEPDELHWAYGEYAWRELLKLRSATMAWAVNSPTGREFDYLVFPEREDAVSQALEFADVKDADSWEIIPLHPGQSVTVS